MFGIDSGELLLIAVVALVVIGPKDLPRAMRTIGNFVGRARGMARHFRAGVDTMMREAELEEMEAKWKAENERIMREFPLAGGDKDWAAASPAGETPEARVQPARPVAPPAPPVDAAAAPQPRRRAPPAPPAPPPPAPDELP